MKNDLCDNINIMKMKKILTVIIAVLGFTGLVGAQNATGTNGSTASATTTAASDSDEETDCYCCPKGDYCSNQAGTCALHVNLNLVKDGEYFCTMEDNITGSSQGSCPVSNKQMKKMEAKKCVGGKDMKNKDDNKSASSTEETQTGE